MCKADSKYIREKIRNIRYYGGCTRLHSIVYLNKLFVRARGTNYHQEVFNKLNKVTIISKKNT